MSAPRVCRACGEPFNGKGLEWLFRGKQCERCGRAACARGDHTWALDAVGPGVCEAECIYCDAVSSGSTAPLEQMGFRPVADSAEGEKE